MTEARRSAANPIVTPDPSHPWEAEAAFNGCVVKHDGIYHMVYRALSSQHRYANVAMNISSVGYAKSTDGTHFTDKRQLFGPEFAWEKFGCEDPRITWFEGKYYIFYTALSTFPFSPEGIHIGVAVTTDFDHFEKYPVTFFNSKAMSLFPERVNGKIAALFTFHTDIPPSKIVLAFFDEETDIWSRDYWNGWYTDIDSHVVNLLRSPSDQVEVGGPPVKTDKGWLFVHSYIREYHSNNKIFGIEASLHDANDPRKVLGRTPEPLLVPQRKDESEGMVPNIAFPSGALIENDTLSIYYGGADTVVCQASIPLPALIHDITTPLKPVPESGKVRLARYPENPIIEPITTHKWETKFTFNPGVVYEGGKFHILYRAQGDSGVSTLGYAMSEDGLDVTHRDHRPAYIPRESFEKADKPGNSGCEDPRLTRIGDRIYMTYTAYDGASPPRVALTDIPVDDFIDNKWRMWSKPKLISPPGIDDKDCGLFPEKINGKYVTLHRFTPHIWIDMRDELDFSEGRWLGGDVLMSPRPTSWDNDKIGIAAGPVKTEAGWLLIYHGITKHDLGYRLGALLLDSNDPTTIVSRLPYPILEPEASYELEGLRPKTVFSNGMAVKDGTLFVYYGAADQVTAVATVKLDELLDALAKYR